MTNKRINPGMSLDDAIKALACNNKDTHQLVFHIVLSANKNDTKSTVEHVDILHCFDDIGMYGKDILIFYNEICRRNFSLLITLVKAYQYCGRNNINRNILGSYLREFGVDGINVDDIISDIKKYLPNLRIVHH